MAAEEGVRRVFGSRNYKVGGSQRRRRGDPVAGVAAVRQTAGKWFVLVHSGGLGRASVDEAAGGAALEPNSKASQGKGIAVYGARYKCGVASAARVRRWTGSGARAGEAVKSTSERGDAGGAGGAGGGGGDAGGGGGDAGGGGGEGEAGEA
eukprot:7062563-Prymnesium_polylepis.1